MKFNPYFKLVKINQRLTVGLEIGNRDSNIYFIGNQTSEIEWEALIPKIMMDYYGLHIGFYFPFIGSFGIQILQQNID